jgi:diguanylate cyclase (GGDEF)-like protein
MIGNIMIIDDSPIERKIIGQVLKSRFQDINIFESDNGLNIADKLMSNCIHVCILDIMMPIKNGFQVLEEMKEDPYLMDIPVIICTGTEDKLAIEKALSLGAYDYFSKPFSEEAMKISLPLKIKNAIDLMKRKEETIYLSYHDKLTGLYNRRYAEEELKRLDKEINLPISLAMGDVNGLKLTNDAFGHEIGDRLLKKIADIINDECNNNEIVARVGGDEFLIIFPKVSLEESEQVVNKIKIKCFMEKEQPIRPSISIGCATKDNIEQDIMMIYKNAEDKMYSNKLTESNSIRSSIISTLINILRERSLETEAHCNRLKDMCIELGSKLGLTIEQIDNLKLLALLHDIGITAIPEYLIDKTIDFIFEDDSRIKNHCEIGYRIAKSLPEIAPIANDILYHHEKWDGSGFPQGLKGEEIPINSRIISILDTYDLLLNGSINKSKNEVLDFIKKHSSTYFDPKIVNTFLDTLS